MIWALRSTMYLSGFPCAMDEIYWMQVSWTRGGYLVSVECVIKSKIHKLLWSSNPFMKHSVKSRLQVISSTLYGMLNCVRLSDTLWAKFTLHLFSWDQKRRNSSLIGFWAAVTMIVSACELNRICQCVIVSTSYLQWLLNNYGIRHCTCTVLYVPQQSKGGNAIVTLYCLDMATLPSNYLYIVIQILSIIQSCSKLGLGSQR